MGDLPIEIKEKSSEMMIHFCCISIDGLFLVLWAGMNFLVRFGVRKAFPPEGTDAIVGYVLETLFAVATLIPISIFIYRDAMVMWRRAQSRIAKEPTS